MDEALLTGEQREDLRRLRSYIEREDLRPVMNNTKWREVIALLRSLQPGFWVQFRAKWVSAEEPRIYEGSFPWHLPQPFFGIEWLDVKTIWPVRIAPESVTEDRTDEILRGLRERSVPFTYADGVVRIWGYLRPGATVVLGDA